MEYVPKLHFLIVVRVYETEAVLEVLDKLSKIIRMERGRVWKFTNQTYVVLTFQFTHRSVKLLARLVSPNGWHGV